MASNKEDILNRIRKNIRQKYDMPRLDDIQGITYPDPLAQFISMTETVGGKVVELQPGQDINQLVRELYPEAKEIASNLPEVTIATRNPDTCGSPQALNGTDVGIIRGVFGVAENACVWIPQAMEEKAVCFISENLVILLKKSEIVNNMHEAYRRIEMNDYGYGTFISGPSKTADIAQVLVMGAQAARSATVVLVP
ncbi:MAG: LUD domain-containing protein [Prevotella sp.]|jgi:L-lactate dehydrogenase complex protein LldG|nr:LUD domain-containing protein [Prevotella sp.]MBQ1774236.1 LUD domain-containing protein [Prevotella sp.]